MERSRAKDGRMSPARKALATACALAVAASLAAPAPASAGLLEPPGKKVWFGVSDTGNPADFGAFSEAVEKHPAVIESFRSWGSDFHGSIERWETARARPMIHITTAAADDGHEILTPRAIAQGAGDGYLIRLNRLFAEKDMRAYVRPLGEPNRCLNVYASYDCGGNLRDAAHKPRWYRLAFRRFYVIVHGGGKAKTINKRLAEAGLPPLNATVGGLPAAPVAIVWSPLPSGSPIVPQNRPKNFWPGSRWVDWAGTDFYASYPEWRSLTGLYNRYAGNEPFALTEWGVENGDDPAFVSRLFAWVKSHPRCKMLVYYQDFGSTSSYRIQNYSASLAVLKARLHSGFFPSFAPAPPHLPPPPPGGIASPAG
jgi:hypothetical protein